MFVCLFVIFDNDIIFIYNVNKQWNKRDNIYLFLIRKLMKLSNIILKFDIPKHKLIIRSETILPLTQNTLTDIVRTNSVNCFLVSKLSKHCYCGGVYRIYIYMWGPQVIYVQIKNSWPKILKSIPFFLTPL